VRRLGLVGLGSYGVATALAGVALAVGFAPGVAPSQAEGVAARPVSAAPVLPARPVAGATGKSSPRPAQGAVPSAQVGRGTVAGSPFRPAQLLLPGGAAASVRSSGVHTDGSLVIPDDPAVVGWWNGGALAGDAFGSIVIAGHVDSARFGLGAMAQLRTLKVGQVVELRSGTKRMRYRVATRRSLPQVELAARTDAFRQDIPPRLVLITCGGAFDPVRHRYQDNLIITAQPVG
jgi:hypothetical protein